MNRKKKKMIKKIPFMKQLAYCVNCRKNGELYNVILQLSNKLQENGVHFIYCEPPVDDRLINLTKFEQERIDNWVFDFNNIEKDIDRLKRIYGDDIDTDYLIQLYDGAKVITVNGEKTVADYSSKYVNIINGRRLTVGQPEKFHNKINIYGPCTVRGTGVEDGQTIASFLQDKVNKNYPDSYYVVNQGIGCGSTIYDDIKRIETTVFQSGDIVILCQHINESFLRFCKKHNVSYIETTSEFKRPHEYGEWFTDTAVHTNKNGNMGIASCIFRKLDSMGILHQSNKKEQKSFILKESFSDVNEKIQDAGLEEYLESLKKYRVEGYKDKKIGAIVMNCNPFTFGHRYLIEIAAKQVEVLYIFVVEENKSFFNFEDRYQLVKLGTQDIDNVIVLPSGRFIISALTFPGYFYKDNNKDAVVDTSKDVDLFGKYIAKVLNIKVRFVGEEPIDMVTRQYNRTMEERLPLYGIEFIEIKRKEIGSQVISASRVRKCLEHKDFEEIRKLVPETTYEYLVKKYS
jgi:[citrate (pro-3S)-lyase] ligase